MDARQKLFNDILGATKAVPLATQTGKGPAGRTQAATKAAQVARTVKVSGARQQGVDSIGGLEAASPDSLGTALFDAVYGG
jgi:hypothetical protein